MRRLRWIAGHGVPPRPRFQRSAIRPARVDASQSSGCVPKAVRSPALSEAKPGTGAPSELAPGFASLNAELLRLCARRSRARSRLATGLPRLAPADPLRHKCYDKRFQPPALGLAAFDEG